MLSLPFALIGLLVGGLINALADDLPARVKPRRPHCPGCGHQHSPGRWLAIARRFRGDGCPNCGLRTRRRSLLVESGVAALFAGLPWFINSTVELIIAVIYIAILILIIVIDVEHRLILHVVTFPTTAIALAISNFQNENSIWLALAGAGVGFVVFFLAYLIGRRLFGAGALGFGDVTLSMMIGAMLGIEIVFALVLGILLAGIWSIAGLASGRLTRRSYFAYGPFLALAGIIMVIWGDKVLAWYTSG